MTAREQLLQELSSAPDRLIIETLDFLRFLKTKERFSPGDAPQTSLATAAEMMRDFYAEGSELTEFIDRESLPNGNRVNEDFSYESLPEDLQVRLAKLKNFIASRAQQQQSPEAAAFFERFKENLDAEREPERKLFHQNYEA